MEIKNKVVSKKTAIALRDAGFPQKTYFYYTPMGLVHLVDSEYKTADCNIAAPDALELEEDYNRRMKLITNNRGEEAAHVWLESKKQKLI